LGLVRTRLQTGSAAGKVAPDVPSFECGRRTCSPFLRSSFGPFFAKSLLLFEVVPHSNEARSLLASPPSSFFFDCHRTHCPRKQADLPLPARSVFSGNIPPQCIRSFRQLSSGRHPFLPRFLPTYQSAVFGRFLSATQNGNAFFTRRTSCFEALRFDFSRTRPRSINFPLTTRRALCCSC